ncbi:hypothetical protein FRUB_03246 [Fimbriiglobus ruber]|uniref:Sulfotransferase domain-containing protein n=1 Tax=Fimbriiglobus ruber TaxID=1908690 RepID=A0A225E5F0_9BACT|nr:hypothetical protein FRUB_03246 [Fimbriiglobus ruber]
MSTPRSGNTWLRHLISAAYGLSETCTHELNESDWQELPDRHAVQIHHGPEPSFLAHLRAHHARPLTIARHPLDVLVSILQFAINEPETSRWLAGRGGDESILYGAMPRSRAFVEYATGPRAKALLAVTRDWWIRPDVIRVRYEEVVAGPVTGLAPLVAAVGPPAEPFGAASNFTLDRLRSTSVNNHFWQGRPGLWRELIPAAEAREIAAAHAETFATLGYTCAPDPDLDPAAADRNWVRLGGASLAAGLRRASVGHAAQVATYQTAIMNYKTEVADLREAVAVREAELARLRLQVAEAARFLQFDNVARRAARVARLLRRVRDFFPKNRTEKAFDRLIEVS